MKKKVNLHNTHIHIYLYIKHDIFFIIYGLYLVYFHCTCIYPNKHFYYKHKHTYKNVYSLICILSRICVA